MTSFQIFDVRMDTARTFRLSASAATLGWDRHRARSLCLSMVFFRKTGARPVIQMRGKRSRIVLRSIRRPCRSGRRTRPRHLREALAVAAAAETIADARSAQNSAPSLFWWCSDLRRLGGRLAV